MNNARAAYMVAFVLVLGAIFAAEVHVPPGFPFGSGATTSTGPHESCTGGWNVTGYYTPVEAGYSGQTQSVNVNGTVRTFYSAFLADVQVEGWGQTKAGDYIGYDSGVYTLSAYPRNSLDQPLKVGDVAVDFAIVPAETNLTIPTLPAPWNTTRFTADDSGPDIVGNHVDVYTGQGATAEQETYRITSGNQTVCAYRLAVGAPVSGSAGLVPAQFQPRPTITRASAARISFPLAIRGFTSI